MKAQYDNGKILLSSVAWRDYREHVYVSICRDRTHEDPQWHCQNFTLKRSRGKPDFHYAIPAELMGGDVYVYAVYTDANDEQLPQDTYYVGSVFCGHYTIEVKTKQLPIFADDKLAHVLFEVRTSEKLKSGYLCYYVEELDRDYPIPVEIEAKNWVKLPGVDLPLNAKIKFHMPENISTDNYDIL